jgi:hypothetical protein
MGVIMHVLGLGLRCGKECGLAGALLSREVILHSLKLPFGHILPPRTATTIEARCV